MADRFADVMQKERDRLHREREQVSNQQQELEDKLAQIDHGLANACCSRRQNPARPKPANDRLLPAGQLVAVVHVNRLGEAAGAKRFAGHPRERGRSSPGRNPGTHGPQGRQVPGNVRSRTRSAALTKSNQVSRPEGKILRAGRLKARSFPRRNGNRHRGGAADSAVDARRANVRFSGLVRRQRTPRNTPFSS